MPHQDRYGLPLSTASDAAAGAYRDGVDLMLSGWTGMAETLERAIAADPDFALPLVARARVHAFYQQGDQARSKAALARELVARRGAGEAVFPCMFQAYSPLTMKLCCHSPATGTPPPP